MGHFFHNIRIVLILSSRDVPFVALDRNLRYTKTFGIRADHGARSEFRHMVDVQDTGIDNMFAPSELVLFPVTSSVVVVMPTGPVKM